MSTFSPNSAGNPDNAWKRSEKGSEKRSEQQQEAHNGDINSRPSKARLRSAAGSLAGTTAVASEGAASSDCTRVEFLENIRLVGLQPSPEKSLVHNRRPPGQKPSSNQRSVPSPPPAAQVPRWSSLCHDNPSAYGMSLRIPADQENTFTSSAKAVDIVHDPSKSPKDITVRVNLPLSRDFQEELEEFCRLRRFGCFHQAEEYFKGNLDRVSDAPYVLIQHAEALLAAGDFKGVSRVINQQLFEFDRLGDNKDAKKLAVNLELLGLLSQPRFPQLAPRALSAAMDGLPGKLDTLRMGSTEVQTLSLSLRVLQYVVDASSQTYTPQISAVREQARASCDWKMLYHELLGDDRIWDLRDLLTAMIPVFGFEDTFSRLLGISSTPQSLQALVDDWIHPEYDESATLGLLDTFSSLILQNVGDHSRTALLLHHSRGLVESIQQHNSQHMKTRPFIQFILARAAVEIEQAWKERDVQGLSEPDGLLVSPGAGINLPIFVPAKHLEKPGWERFYAQTPPSLREAVKIALQAAKFTGDYALQATAWKLLILQSQEPKPMMEGLARLQLDLQDDKEGFLTTCLSKYLTTLDREEEDGLLKELDRLDDISGGTYLSWGFNASLLWARSIIQGHLESSTQGPTDEISGAMQDPGKVCRDEIYAYGARLSDRAVRFLDSAFNIAAPRPLRVSFNELQNRAQAQAAEPADSPQQQESHSPRQDSVQRADDPSTKEKKELRDADTIVKLDNRIRSARHAERWASPPPVPQPRRLENYFGSAQTPPNQTRRTFVTTDGKGRTTVTVRDEDSSDDYGEGDSSSDYSAGTKHRTADSDTDADVDIRVRHQYSEAKNARQTVHPTRYWQPQEWDEISIGDQWSPISDDDDDTKVYTSINPRRSDMDFRRRRFNSTRVSSRPNINYVRAGSPSHYYKSRQKEMEMEGKGHRRRVIYPGAAFTRDNLPPYPSAFQGGYPTHVEGFPQPVRTFPSHPWAPSIHPGALPPHLGNLPLTPGGVPPPPVYPPGMYYGGPYPPQQPGYFPVSGWPATWQQDANRLLSPADPQTQSFAQPPPPLLLERDTLQEQGAYPPQGIVSSADDALCYDRLDTQHFFPLPPVAEERDSTVDATAVKEAEADGEKDSTPKAADNDDGDGEEDDEGYEGSPRTRIQDGLPKLDFPPKILDDNTMTVLVRSKADPQKGKIYTISKEGVTESDVSKVAGYPPQDADYPPQDAGYPRQDAGYPRQDAGYPRQDVGYPHQESSGVRRRSPSIRRRASYRGTSVSRPEPLPHGPVRTVPDAPPPPRADSFAAKAKGPNGGQEVDVSTKTTGKKATTEPEMRQHRRQHSITKTDAPKSSAKPGPPDKNPISGTFVANPRKMHTKDRYISPAAVSPSRAGTEDQRVPQVRERLLTDKPAPEQGTKNKNQAYAETDGESDARPDSPVDNSRVGSETKAVPPDGQQDEEDRSSVTAQRGGSERGEGGKGIARAQTWNL
ncbi:hypothetical protein B0T18DRAFT_34029 [Schizothecium vesticola]|uniref:Uncharacterized protein n=1 Tax=Schizothecium vesticola TaxID=314040 RepID=A0AA40KCX4_9PEZI|nr:hypothetical protein B0T18DRAFT_34029 [Schizothecium vesticola]